MCAGMASVVSAAWNVCTEIIRTLTTNPMSPLAKARVVVEVRRKYEEADTREERCRLARELEKLCWEKSTEPLQRTSQG